MRDETLFASTDTLRFRLQAMRTLVQEDVRVAVQVAALVSTRDYDAGLLDTRIRAALRDFIPADWTFSRLTRVGDAVGYEQVRLTAWTRVSPNDIHNLAERARVASREGLSLTGPAADFAIPPQRMARIVHELRLEILDQAAKQLQDYRDRTGRDWRLGDLDFGIVGEGWAQPRTAKGAYRSNTPEFNDEPEAEIGLSGAERVTLVAEVVLKSAAPAAQ